MPHIAERALREWRHITERKRMETALRESEERYALAARGANDGLWDWDLLSNTVYFSPRWKSMLGYEEHDIGETPDEWFKRVHPEDRERVHAEISSHIEGCTPHFESEYRMLHKDNAYRWMLCRGLAVQDADRRAYRMAGSQTDITGRKMVEEQLFYAASHDALTGLPNRALFLEHLEHVIERAKRYAAYMFAVLFLDLDRFKMINDSLGHQAGDHLLIEFSRRLEACMRPVDKVARFGGDEFAIILDQINTINDVRPVVSRIEEALTVPFKLDGHEVFTTASIGITPSTVGYDRPEDVLRDADIAMYRAKARGRARHELFDPSMHTGETAQ
jgi:diguanylate cyclase (GGDEF)-like protein/PAS domain S-box-containing protein